MMKLLINMFFMVLLCCTVCAQNDPFNDDFVESTFIAEGKGSTPEGAKVEARVEAMHKFLKLNMDSGDYEAHNSGIDAFLRENFREYTENPNEIEPYNNLKIRVMVEVRGNVLLTAIKQKFLRARSKGAGIWVSINADSRKSSESLDVVLATVQNELGKHFTIRDTMAMKQLMEKEAKMLDLSASSDPKNYVWRDFSSIPIQMYFWLNVGIKYDDATGGKVYRARIGARAVHVVTAHELFQFQHEKIGYDRDQTIISASVETAQQIVSKVGSYNTILAEQEFTYKFVNFSDQQEREKIKHTMLTLANGRPKFLDILPGGVGGGPNYFTYEVKWQHQSSQFEMIQIILEYMASNQVLVKCDKFTQKVMIFEPPTSNWQEGGNTNPHTEPNYPTDEPVYEEVDCNYIEAEGRGSSSRLAIAQAWNKAMMIFLKDNMEYEYFEGNRSRIEEHIGQNWKEYTLNGEDEFSIITRFDGRKIRIKVCIDEERLMRDMHNRFKKADDKMQGLWVAIVSDESKNPYQDTDPKAKDEMTDRDVMFDNVQNLLSKNMQVRDLRDITRLMQKEAQMLGLPAGASPEDFVARKDAQLQIMVYLWLTTRRVDRDPAMGVPVWYATIGCRMVHIQTAQELIRFQISSGDTYVDSSSADGEVRRTVKPSGVFGGLSERMARIEAIENASKAVYSKIHRELSTRKTVLEEDVYTIKFAGFSPSEERNIKYAMLDLKSGQRKYCDIENSSGGGSGYMEYRLKWRRPGHTQADIIDIIYGYCQDNQVRADSNKSTKGVIYFQPIGSHD